VNHNQGDYATARSFEQQSLEIFRALGDRQRVAYSLHNLGNAAREQGDYTTARALEEESLEIFREPGDKRGIAASLHGLGSVAYEQGDYATARMFYGESLEIQRKLENRHGIAMLLESFVSLAGAQGQPERALRLAGAAAALREVIGTPLPPLKQVKLEHHLETARQALGEEVSARTFADGRAMTMEQAIESASL
jgi:tetratricopeptide (TPR) repeat protein